MNTKPDPHEFSEPPLPETAQEALMRPEPEAEPKKSRTPRPPKVAGSRKGGESDSNSQGAHVGTRRG